MNLDKIIRLFINQEDYRAWIRYPFTNNERNMIFATDANAMLCIKTNEVPDSYVSQSDKLKNIYPYGKHNCDITITLQQIKNCIDSIKTVSNDKCLECCGSGEVTWSYEHYEKEFECPVCNGIGKIETKTPIFNKYAGVDIEGLIFQSDKVDRFYNAMITLDILECKIVYKDDFKIVLKLYDDIELIQMKSSIEKEEVKL